MSFDVEKKKVDRQPFTIVELDMDFCQNTFGQAPCTASRPPGQECFNTRITCLDPANYNKGVKTYRFCTLTSAIPLGQGFIPAIDQRPKFSSTRLEPEKGIGARGTVSVSMVDFQWPDRDCDPYVDNRNYVPRETGTFWGKFLARNPYYVRRIMRVKTGYLSKDGSYNAANFKTRTYFIEKIDGPDQKGRVTIKGKDILKFVDDKSAVIPPFSEGLLSAPLAINTTSGFTLVPSGVGANYPVSNGTVRIGDEVIGYASRSGDVFTTLTRGAYNTIPNDHDQNDVAQLCYTMTNLNVVDFIHELLTKHGNIDGDTYIPYDAGRQTPTGTPDEWDHEKADWLSSWNLTGIISDPTGVKKILAEVGIACNLAVWWNPTESKVKLKANVPPRAGVIIKTLDDQNHLVRDSVKVRVRQDMRLSRVYVWYKEISPIEEVKASNYQLLEGDIDIDSEGPTRYGEAVIRQIYARFFDETNAGEASSLSGRLLSRFFEAPNEVEFMVDAKDEDLEVGDLVSIESRAIQSVEGFSVGHELQIIEAQEVVPGHLYKYKGLTSRYSGRYGRIGPDTLGDYPAESDANKRAYGWICYDNGIFTSDGSNAYRII